MQNVADESAGVLSAKAIQLPSNSPVEPDRWVVQVVRNDTAVLLPISPAISYLRKVGTPYRNLSLQGFIFEPHKQRGLPDKAGKDLLGGVVHLCGI